MAVGDLNVALVLKLVDKLTGGPTRAVISSLEDIGKATDTVGKAGVEWSNRQLAANRARKDALRREALEVAAMGAALVAVTEPAIQAERRLAEISKVVEFNSPDGLTTLNREIRDLVTTGGLATTAAGIQDIVAAAGRMGVVDANLPDAEKRKKLLDFAEDASQMGVAFGISSELAGTSLARWRQNLGESETAMGLSQRQAMALADAINLLGNTMATNEADIVQVINRQGVVAQTAGLATNEIAALSAALLAAGASPEIAATGLKNFTNALTRGSSATKRQSDVFEALGIDATIMAKRMQTDATGGILSVLDAFKNIEPYRRNSLIGDLFGEEAKGAIAPLIANAELLRQTFEKTADSSAFLGGVEAEYQRQAATTFAQRQRLLEYIKGLSVTIGSELLPMLNEMMASVMPVVTAMTEWAEAHPEIIRLAFLLATGLVALRVATLLTRFAFVTLIGPVLHIIRAGSWLLRILPRLGAAMVFAGRVGGAVLLGSIKGLIGAFKVLGRLVLLNPIALIIMSIAGLAYVVYQNWDQIVVFLKTKLADIKSAFDEGLLNGVFKLLSELNPFTLALEGAAGLIDYITGWDISGIFADVERLTPFTAAKATAEAFYDYCANWDFKRIVDSIVSSFAEINLYDAGVTAIKSFWQGMKSLLSQMAADLNAHLVGLLPDWTRSGPAASKPRGPATSNFRQTSKVPKVAGPIVAPPPLAPASDFAGRDSGGPIRPRQIYKVGERGPELFVSDVAGRILPSRALRAAAAATAIATPLAADVTDPITQRIDTRPPVSASAPAARQIRREGDTINITINAGGGSAPDIAREVERVLRRRDDDRRAQLHDGVDY